MVYTVIVTYNGGKWIRKCLRSVIDDGGSRVIVIDNGSNDETVGIIEQEFQAIDLYVMGNNFGFGQANNLGILRALEKGATHVFLVNQDVYVSKGAVHKLQEVMLKEPHLGIVSPTHLNGTGSGLDQLFERYIRSARKPEGKVWLDVVFVNAAAWMISRKCLEECGGFDPFFFHYGEDHHYSYKVRHHRYMIGVLPDVHIYHDREKRPLVVPTVAHRVDFESRNFFVEACRPDRGDAISMTVKRICRSGLMGLVNWVKRKPEEAEFHFSMARKLLWSVKGISACRARNSKNEIYVLNALMNGHSVRSMSNAGEMGLGKQ